MEELKLENRNRLAIVIAGNFTDEDSNSDPVALLNNLPCEIAEKCEIIEWSSQPGCHYSTATMLDFANELEEIRRNGYKGIIVIFGTGVMAEIAYLTNLLWEHEEPVIFANLLVALSESKSAGFANFKNSVITALSDESQNRGVLVCSSGELYDASDVAMLDPVNPDNTFFAPHGTSVGKVLNGEIHYHAQCKRPGYLARRPEKMANVEIVASAMGSGDTLISSIANLARDKKLDGVILSGLGTGNVPSSWVPSIMNIIRSRVPVAIVSRCPIGSLQCSNDFEGGYSRLLEMGVIKGEKLNPYQARIKMSLGIGAGLTQCGLTLYMQGKSVSDDIPELYK